MSMRRPSSCGRFLSFSAAIVMAGCAGESNTYAPPPPPEVTWAHPIERSIPVFIEENGQTEAVGRAEVRARVTGVLMNVNFSPADVVSPPVEESATEDHERNPELTPGEDEEAGQEPLPEEQYELIDEQDALFLIEEDQYRAVVNAARAAVEAANSEIEVASAKIATVEVERTRALSEFQRQEELKEQNATTQQAFDNAKAANDAAEAQFKEATASLAVAEANASTAREDLAQANLNLSYTRVAAPIAGRITANDVKEGNLVQEGTLLATIVNREQIYAHFNISDRQALQLQRAALEEYGDNLPEEIDYSQFQVSLQREGDEGFPFLGHLDYVDQEGVDQSTGTLALRAIFDNPNELIIPGLFVRVRLHLDESHTGILVPEASIARDPQGMYVQVIDQENKLQRRNIVTGQILNARLPRSSAADGEGENGRVVRMVVVREGLTVDDRVVVEGGFGAGPAAEVAPQPTAENYAAIVLDDRPGEASTEDDGSAAIDGTSE